MTEQPGDRRSRRATTVQDSAVGRLDVEHRRRIRVVFVDHVARLSGAEIALVRLVQAVGSDVEAHVILGEDGPLREQLVAAGAQVHLLPLEPTLRDVRRQQLATGRIGIGILILLWRYVWRLRGELVRLEPDIVHTNSLKAALYGGLAGRLARVPVVWHTRDRIAADYLPRPAVLLVRLLSRVLPTTVVANSRATLATLPKARRGSVLFNPVVPDIAPVPTSAAPATPAQQSRPLHVGIVGRLAPWKGHRVFLEAFAHAFARGEAQAWVIGAALFGDQDVETELRAHAERLGIAEEVVWRGFRPEIAAELAQLDILVHASTLPEPFGQVIVEGMAAGVPVIASGAGGPLEIIRDGEDGLLVSPGDASALAQALRDLAADPQRRRRMGEAARRSSQRFSPSAARLRLLDVYRQTLGQRR